MRRQSTGLKALFVLMGDYLWRNRHEIRSRLRDKAPFERLLGARFLERLRGLRPSDPLADKERPIEAQYRKIS